MPFFSGCLGPPSTAYVPVEAHLLVLQIPEWFQTQMSFALHNSIPKSPQNAFILLLGSLSSLPPPTQFLFEFELSWEFPFQPNWPPAMPAAFPVCRNGPFLCFEEVLLDDQSGLLGAFVLQNCLLQCPINQFQEQAKVQDLYSATCFPLFSQYRKLEHCMVTAAKTDINKHVPKQLFSLCE